MSAPASWCDPAGGRPVQVRGSEKLRGGVMGCDLSHFNVALICSKVHARVKS